jgi:hypothetical protein
MFGKTVVKTEAEKRELLKQAKAEWDAIDPAISHLVAASEEHYLARIADGIEIERQPFVPASPPTAQEEAALNGRLTMLRLYGDRASDPYDGLPDALREMAKANDEAEFQKLLVGPGKRAESQLESMIRNAIEKAMSNRNVPRGESDRTGIGIMPRLAAATEDDTSAAARFIRAYVDNDEQTMRGIARELVAA